MKEQGRCARQPRSRGDYDLRQKTQHASANRNYAVQPLGLRIYPQTRCRSSRGRSERSRDDKREKPAGHAPYIAPAPSQTDQSVLASDTTLPVSPARSGTRWRRLRHVWSAMTAVRENRARSARNPERSPSLQKLWSPIPRATPGRSACSASSPPSARPADQAFGKRLTRCPRQPHSAPSARGRKGCGRSSKQRWPA